MKRMNIREFKAGFHRVTEPIEVLRRTETIGIFYPTGFGPPTVSRVSGFPPVREEILPEWTKKK